MIGPHVTLPPDPTSRSFFSEPVQSEDDSGCSIFSLLLGGRETSRASVTWAWWLIKHSLGGRCSNSPHQERKFIIIALAALHIETEMAKKESSSNTSTNTEAKMISVLKLNHNYESD